MFTKLTRLMSEEKIYSLQELSHKLGISAETLRSYIDYLSEKDLFSQPDFEKEESTCTGNCAACKGCGGRKTFKNAPTLWEFKRSESESSLDL